jgi:hypothetical protein
LTNKVCNDGNHANDPDCAETQCFDGIDNNLNNLTDCEDPNCQQLFSVCAPTIFPSFAPSYFPTPPPTKKICQGVLILLNGTSVTCSQYRGFENFTLYSGEYLNGTVPKGNITATIVTTSSVVTDTSVNCALYGNVNYNASMLLPVHGLHSGPDRNFVMFQHLSLSMVPFHVLNSTYGAILFMKGSVGGSGLSTISAADRNWLDSTSQRMCPPNSPQELEISSGGYSIFPVDGLKLKYKDENCSEFDVNGVEHTVGWTQVNVTSIFQCQLHHGSTSLDLVWTQEDNEIDGQIWYSSASGESGPYLAVYSTE